MRAGKLRHRVTIEALTVTLVDGMRDATSSDSDSDSDGMIDEDPNAEGERVESWSDAVGMMVSAAIEPLSGRDLIAAQAAQSEVSTRVTIRYRPGIVPTMRVRHRSTTYDIKAILADAASGTGHLTLLCGAGVNEG